MRNLILFITLILGSMLLPTCDVKAQPGARKPPRVGSSTVPARPGSGRTAGTESEEEKPAARPPARMASNEPSAPSEEEVAPAEDRQPAARPRGGARFADESSATDTNPSETEEPSTSRQGFRSASLENQNKTRGNPPSRRLLEPSQEAAPEEPSAEPAPLANRGTARGIEAQAIQVSLNDTPAGEVLSTALNYQHEGAITGYPIRMEQVLAAAPDGTSRRAAVRAYWNLVVSIADYHHALDEADRLNQVAASSGDKLIEAGAAAADARVAETKITVTAAQYDLATLTAATGSLPIPADAPVVGEYRTEYVALFGRGPAPAGIKRLSVMLPLYSYQVSARGRAVVAATAAQAKSDDLQTFKELSAHRRAFLACVRDYNDAIADYALQLTTPGMPVETVTSMLIVRTQPAADSQPDLSISASRGDREVVPATATAPIDQAVIKPRRIGSVRQVPAEAEPVKSEEPETDPLAAEQLTTEESSAEPDATEAPAKRRDLRFSPSRPQE